TIQKLVTDEERLKQRSDIAQKVEAMRTTLLEKGAGSLLNQLSSTDQRVEMQRTTENQHNSLIEARHQLASLVADREAFVQSWSTDLSKELVAAQNALDTAVAQLEKANKHSESVRLVAPEDATVLSVAKLSMGSVLKPGDPLVTIVSLETPLEAEIHISTREVGFVRPGDRVTIKVDAFNFAEHGTAEGAVKWISEGTSSIDEETGQPTEAYYRARVSLVSLNFIRVPQNFRLIPGMTLEADINVGRRSLGAYLLEGFIRGASGAMREP
ncbi:MAG: HlyD family efflux transporter periplasmic adaptor subunit, partial [Alphaproteobacteria bacterium]|nr:HlyD family efflux transporter periplasmic adaptor subunit [Alphaproteobacteria bacterium]